MTFDPTTAIVAVLGLFIQAVVGWVYVRVLKDEVKLLREKSDEHTEAIAENRARLNEHTRILAARGRLSN